MESLKTSGRGLDKFKPKVPDEVFSQTQTYFQSSAAPRISKFKAARMNRQKGTE